MSVNSEKRAGRLNMFIIREGNVRLIVDCFKALGISNYTDLSKVFRKIKKLISLAVITAFANLHSPQDIGASQ